MDSFANNNWNFPAQPFIPRATTPTPLEVNTNLDRPVSPAPGPRTPMGGRLRAHTLSAIPRTPLPKISTELAQGSIWNSPVDEDRPGSASSTHSQSSNFSFYSLASGGGSCTSPEDDTVQFVFPTKPEEKEKKVREKREEGSNDPHWTPEMDDHLWRTYTMYQQDARMTPFYVVPGGVPPLGVCCRVVRAAKKTWRQNRMDEGVPNPKGSRFRIPKITIGNSEPPKSPTTNKGDMMRKMLPFEWPASESASRKRLRILCKTQYGPPVNFHNRQMHPPAPSRGLRMGASRRHQSEDISSLSSFRSSLGEAFSSRAMQISLLTSSSTTMRPDGVLAGWSAGIDEEIPESPEVSASLPEQHFLPPISSIPELPVSPTQPSPAIQAATPAAPVFARTPARETFSPPLLARFSTMPTQRSRAGSLMLESLFDAPPSLPLSQPLAPLPALGSALGDSTQQPSALLPPLELKSSSSPFGTWPRRRRRPAPTSTPSPPRSPVRENSEMDATPIPSNPKRSLLSNVFPPSPLPAISPNATPTAPNQSSTHRRNLLMSAPGPAPRRRLNLTADTPYRHHRSSESLSSLPRLAHLNTASEYLTVPGAADDCSIPRLGSPFREKRSPLKGRLVRSSESLGRIQDFGFVPALGPVGGIGGVAIPARKSSLGWGEERPVKRVRE